MWTGTSFVAPQVAGEVARRLARLRTERAAATPRDALAELLDEGTPLADHGVAVRVLSGTFTT